MGIVCSSLAWLVGAIVSGTKKLVTFLADAITWLLSGLVKIVDWLIVGAAQLINITLDGLSSIITGLLRCLAGYACCCRPKPEADDPELVKKQEETTNLLAVPQASPASVSEKAPATPAATPAAAVEEKKGWFGRSTSSADKTAEKKEEVKEEEKKGWFRSSSNSGEKKVEEKKEVASPKEEKKGWFSFSSATPTPTPAPTPVVEKKEGLWRRISSKKASTEAAPAVTAAA
jgi:hypothetical protein